MQACKVALQLVLISQGVPFIHSGQEFFRTKMGIENSYKSSDVYNRIDYARRDKYKKNVNAIKDLIEIRKEYSVFRMTDPKEISERIHLLEGLSNFHMVTVEIVDKENKFYIIIKNDDTVRSITLTNTIMIFNSNAKCNNFGNIYSLKDPGVYILKEKK
jgi:pullulanase